MKKRLKRLLQLSKSISHALPKTRAYWLLAGATLLTITLGMLGFASAFPELSPFTTLYMTMQLFLGDSQSIELVDTRLNQDEAPGTLEWARWMAVAISGSAVLLTVWKFLMKSQGRLRINQLSEHLIIYGSGPTVEGILKEVDESRKPCVLISSCQQLVQRRRNQGKLAVEIAGAGGGQPTLERNHLEEVGLEDATTFYALSPSDSENLRASLLAQDVRGSAGTEIIVRQDEPFSCDLLQRNDGVLSPGRGGGELRVISVEKTRARMLLKQYPLEWHEEHGHATEIHLVIPELDRFAKAVAIQAALVGHYKGGRQVNLWLGSDEESGEGVSQLEQDYPGIRKCLSAESLGKSGLNSIPERVRGKTGSLVTVLMTHVSAEEGYIEALRLHEEFPPGNHLRVILQSPLPGHPAGGKLSLDLCVAPALEGLLKNFKKLDDVAHEIHDRWHKENKAKITKARSEGDEAKAKELSDKPTYKTWEKLTEQQKDDNRTAADHIEVKIRTVNLDPDQHDLREKWVNLSDDDLDCLSRMEHARWAASLWLRNYEVGGRNELRRHPNLVAYDDLDKGTQKYDTDQVRAAADYHKGE